MNFKLVVLVLCISSYSSATTTNWLDMVNKILAPPSAAEIQKENARKDEIQIKEYEENFESCINDLDVLQKTISFSIFTIEKPRIYLIGNNGDRSLYRLDDADYYIENPLYCQTHLGPRVSKCDYPTGGDYILAHPGGLRRTIPEAIRQIMNNSIYDNSICYECAISEKSQVFIKKYVSAKITAENSCSKVNSWLKKFIDSHKSTSSAEITGPIDPKEDE